MKKQIFIYTLLSVYIAACNRPPSAISNTNPFIMLDSTYDYYIREYYTEEEIGKGYVLKSKDEAAPGNRKLIEVEYLFVSNDGKNNVIYLNTIPDRRQRRYSLNYLGRDSINMNDVRMLHFGKRIDQRGRIYFEFAGFNKTDRDTWEIKRTPGNDSILVLSIAEVERNELTQVMIVDSALSRPVVFERVSSFALVYQEGVSKKKELRQVIRNKLYYQAKDPRQVVIYSRTGTTGDTSTQVFEKKRIVYDPHRVFNKQ